jgi:WhiB family redox-sensing transcriptional regulator
VTPAEWRALMTRPEWQTDAACRGMDSELFYPGQGEDPNPAKAICRLCDVQASCLAYALNRPERFGVWGGLTVRERRRILKAKANAA